MTSAETQSAPYRAALPHCVGRYIKHVPLVSTGPRPNQSAIASLQRQVNVVVGRANRALNTQRRRSLATLLIWSSVTLVVMALIFILVGWFVTGRGLRPIRLMAYRARRITEENLHERLAVGVRDDELGELAHDFDDVLARLEYVFAAQQRFVANASHELRTPVALERTLLELALSAPDAGADTLRRTCEQVLASSKKQHEMIEALLLLARSQAGTDIDVPIDLSDLLRDQITLRTQLLAELAVVAELRPSPVRGDPALLERLIANLVDNAIRHNHLEGGWIKVETGTEAGASWLRIANSGPQIPEVMIDKLFEPFHRMSRAHFTKSTGVGLGLSIVRTIADAHGATLQANQLTDGGLRIDIRFPPRT